MLSFICHCGVMCLKQQVWVTSFGQDINKSPIRGSCKQAVYLETARIRAHVQGSYKGSWPLTSQVDYKVRRPLIFLREIRAQNMSGCENCHQLGRWHVEGREKMRDCIYPLLTRRLSGHQKKLSNLVYHGTTSCMTASLEVDCEQSLILLLNHSIPCRSRAWVRGEWQTINMHSFTFSLPMRGSEERRTTTHSLPSKMGQT